MPFMVKKSLAVFSPFALFVSFVVNAFSVLTLPLQALHVLHGEKFFCCFYSFTRIYPCASVSYNGFRKTPRS